MEIKIEGFGEGETIPVQYTADDANVSPALRWKGVPGNAQSLALVCDDPDAPRGTWVHWVLFNLPANVDHLPEHVPTTKVLANGAKQGTNDFGNIGYGGPSPPRGKPHRYFFRLYALDAALDLEAGCTRAELDQAMKGHLVASAQGMGKYGRT